MPHLNIRRLLPWTLGLVLAAGLLAWAGVAWFGKKPAQGRPPYWRRNDWMSKLLLDLQTGPRGVAAVRVPDGFAVEQAAGPDLVNYPMFVVFDDRGRLFACESAGRNISDQDMEKQHEMRVRLVEDSNGDGVFDRGKVFADRLSMCMGAVWFRGSLYVAAPPDILRLTDTDGDGVADRREVLLTGWPLHSNGTTLHGPYLGPDGWMYLTYNLGPHKIQTKEGTVLEGPGGRVFRFRPDGTGLEWIVGGGYDNGIEMVFTAAGEMIGTMTYFQNPRMGLRDALLHYVEGGVYPKWRPIVDERYYKRTGELMPAMTKFARVAPAGLEIYRGAAFGPAFRGNLFSALFNPHRILRHVVERDGATFRTVDEDFLVSSDPDFHPTDVAADADGSLLVIETGAWYLHSCPVSRIAKPEFKGAIYRVRRRDAKPVRDPWGLELKLETRAPAELARFLDDPRPAVRDKALDLAVQAGEPAVEPLAAVGRRHASPEVRAAAVFGLARIGTAGAAETVRAALADSHFLVRVAAARMVGLAKDRAAVDALVKIVQRDEPAARRQAATALGQIGDPRAVPALLAAAASPDDRFVEHSVIYSLITLKTPGPAIEALRHSSPKTRKAALIALDQMDGDALRREQFAPLIDDADSDVRRAALWVASHHADWAGEVLQFLRARLRTPAPSPEEATLVGDTLVSLCQNAEAQAMIAGALGDDSGTPQQLFLLDTVERCAVKEFPAAWTDRLRRHLRATDPALRARAVALVRTRQLAALDDELERIAGAAAESDELRTQALGVLVARRAALSAAHFDFLLRLLRPETEADTRLAAAQILGRARLSDAQLTRLAREHVPTADPLVLPSLLDAFGAARGEPVTRALVEALLASPRAAEGLAGERIPELVRNFPSRVQSAARPLLDRVQKEKDSRADRLRALEPLLAGGDPHRGREIFFGKKAACASCHTIMAEGADVGPDLTGVGAVRSGLDLLEAIVYPSASFVPGHEIYRVETAVEVFSGVQGESNPEAVVIVSGPRDRVRIPRKSIVSMRPSLVSLMPDGFADNLTRDELRDLLAFLQSQKARTEPSNVSSRAGS